VSPDGFIMMAKVLISVSMEVKARTAYHLDGPYSFEWSIRTLYSSSIADE